MKKYNWIKILDNIISEINSCYEILSKLNMENSGKSKLFADKENDRCKRILEIQKNNINDYLRVQGKRYLALGTILILTPFSSAYTSILHKLIPSLIVGNKCIIKSSDFTNQCSKYFIQLIQRCLPNQIAKNIIFIEDLQTIKDIICSQKFDAILFTGKSETAKEIKSKIGRKRGVFETGSLALAYIDDNISTTSIAKDICENSFAQNGMRCIGLKNVFIHKNIYETIKREILTLRINFKNDNNYITEFKNLKTKEEIMQNIKIFLENGYKNLNQDLSFPIILEVCQNTKLEFLKEMYGPVLCLHEVDSFANIPTSYLKRSSLSTSIYSDNLKLIKKFIERDKYTGTILINKGPAIRNDNKSFGGFYDENENKESFWDVLNVVSNIQIIED